MSLRDVPGVLTAAELTATVDSIARHQRPNGMIQWFADGHADPWNHVEAAMARSTVGHSSHSNASRPVASVWNQTPVAM